MTTDEQTTTQPDADAYRIEHDTMGEVRVPRDALYQAQTQRAIENFPISGTPIEPAVVRALGRIKGAAARANDQLGVVPSELADKIPFYRLRHLVRPGLSGWAQVKYSYAGSEAETLEKLQYEFYYLRHQSLSLDLRIVGRTFRSVAMGEGR